MTYYTVSGDIPEPEPVAPSDPAAPEGQARRVTSDTGGQKETKSARFDLIPAEVLWELAEHYGRGAEKYGEHNWALGYDWNLSYAALQRHANQFWRGEDVDDEGFKHLTAVIFHAAALLHFSLHPEQYKRFDNRWEETPDF